MTAFAAQDPLDRLERDIRFILDPRGGRALGAPAKSRAGSASVGAAVALALIGGVATLAARRASDPVGRPEVAATHIPAVRPVRPAPPSAPAASAPELVASAEAAPPPERAASTRPTPGDERPSRIAPAAERHARPAARLAARPMSPERVAAAAPIRPAPIRPAPIRLAQPRTLPPRPRPREDVAAAPPRPERPRADASPTTLADVSPQRFTPRVERPAALLAAATPPVQEKRRARRESVDALLTLRRQW